MKLLHLSDIAGKNNKNVDETIKIKDNEVVVSLSNQGGYSFKFFSDYDVKYSLKQDLLIPEDYILKINIGEREE